MGNQSSDMNNQQSEISDTSKISQIIQSIGNENMRHLRLFAARMAGHKNVNISIRILDNIPKHSDALTLTVLQNVDTRDFVIFGGLYGLGDDLSFDKTDHLDVIDDVTAEHDESGDGKTITIYDDPTDRNVIGVYKLIMGIWLKNIRNTYMLLEQIFFGLFFYEIDRKMTEYCISLDKLVDIVKSTAYESDEDFTIKVATYDSETIVSPV